MVNLLTGLNDTLEMEANHFEVPGISSTNIHFDSVSLEHVNSGGQDMIGSSICDPLKLSVNC